MNQSGVSRDPYHGGTLNGNSCKKLLEHIDILQAICQITVQPYVVTFRAFRKVVRSCFSIHLDDDFEETINEFKENFIELGISVTPKVHAVFFHVPIFCKRHHTGLGIFSEQASEAVHSKFEKTWTKYKVSKVDNSLYNSRILKAVVDFNSTHI